jgi:hypothetical protein
MGARLALAAFDAAAVLGLDGNPARVLTRMALSALDDAGTPVYFGGWEPLAVALGRVVPPPSDDPAVIRARRQAEEAVRLAMRPLVALRLVSVERRGAPGRNARYSLALGPVDNSATPPTEPGVSSDASPLDERGNTPGSARPTPLAQPGAEEKEEKEEEERASAPPATTCIKHPDGNSSEPCTGCMRARQARDALPTLSQPQSVQPDDRCEPGRHRLVEDGTCLRCPTRAADIAAEAVPSSLATERKGRHHA